MSDEMKPPEGLRNRILNRNDLKLEDYYYLERSSTNQAIQIVERYLADMRSRAGQASYAYKAIAADELLTQLRAAQPEAVEDECSGNNLEPYTIPFAAAQPEPQPSVNQCVEEVKRLRNVQANMADEYMKRYGSTYINGKRDALNDAIEVLEALAP